MRNINKQLINELKLEEEPKICSIHIEEYIEEFKNNGYFMLFLIECFIKKRNDDILGQSKNLNEYITIEKMLKSFKKYKEILSKINISFNQ